MIIALLASLQAVSGQGNLRFNVHFDPQFAWMKSSDSDVIKSDGSIFHMQAGLQLDYYFQDNYAFVLGFGINNLGGKLQYEDSVSYANDRKDIILVAGQQVKMNLQYLDIPIGLKLKTEELGYGTFFIQLGFNPMFNINAHISSEDGIYEKDDIKNSISTFCMGYHAEGGFEYRLGGDTALLGGVRWASGLTNVTENDGTNLSPNVISIHLGLQF